MSDPITGGAVIGAAAQLATLSEQLGILAALRRKLLKQSDAASAKLETVLIELSKVYGVLDNTVNDYLGLWLIPEDGNSKHRQEIAKLRRYASGSHEVEMRKAKGDCKKIWSIYVAYLSPWFSRILKPQEAEKLQSLFRHLSDIDSTMVDAIELTARWLRTEAIETLALVQHKDYAAADARIQAADLLWAPQADMLRESLKTLWDPRAAFIGVSRAV